MNVEIMNDGVYGSTGEAQLQFYKELKERNEEAKKLNMPLTYILRYVYRPNEGMFSKLALKLNQYIKIKV